MKKFVFCSIILSVFAWMLGAFGNLAFESIQAQKSLSDTPTNLQTGAVAQVRTPYDMTPITDEMSYHFFASPSYMQFANERLFVADYGYNNGKSSKLLSFVVSDFGSNPNPEFVLDLDIVITKFVCLDASDTVLILDNESN
ncbi:MAG: hypothetical protein FWD76_06095, partial [Firmicutes bacterium]|nr:hypothetical protein [Bacillota bacterium]